MKKTAYRKFIWIVTILLFQQTLALGQVFEWAKRAGLSAFDLGYSICTDKIGNVYIAGKYEMNANFGGTFVTCEGNHDIYVAKYSPSGVFQWVRTAGGTIGDYARAIACDEAGDVYVTGEFETTSIFSPTVSMTAHGGNDVFVAKYTTNGDFVWAKSIGGGGKSDRGYGIAYYKSGVYVTGDFQERAFFPSRIIVESKGSRDIFLAKYTAGGSFKWIKTIGGSGTDIGYAIDNDAEGNLYVTGTFSSTVDFGGVSLTSKGGEEIFIAKYDTNGVLKWASRAGGRSKDNGNGIGVDNTGKVYITGTYNGNITFDTKTLNPAGSGQDIFVACYDAANGKPIWMKGGGGSYNDYGKALAVDGSSNVYITGGYARAASFDGKSITGNDDFEIFFASYNGSGTIRWALGAGGMADEDRSTSWVETGLSIATDHHENVWVSGGYRSNSTFGSITLEALGHTDVYLAKIRTKPLAAHINPSNTASYCVGGYIILQATMLQGSTYTWKKDGDVIPNATTSGYKVTQSGSYTVTIVNAGETATSAPVVVSAVDNIKPDITPAGPVSFCSDSAVLLSTTSNAAYQYQWKKGTVNIQGATSSSYWPASSGDYQVKVTNGPCVNWSKYVSVTVKTCPPKDSTGTRLARLEAMAREEAESKGKLKTLIYPNPNNGLFTLEVKSLNIMEETGEISVELFSDFGQVIYKKTMPYYRGYLIELIDLENTVPVGIYTLTVKAGSSVKSKRISFIR